ncbi:MAG: hypothetical protein KBC26_00590 [Candidatus Pacebacteria bacterium]|nr:hypothetical protein [Candidatus Paceibacterota bacterium]
MITTHIRAFFARYGLFILIASIALFLRAYNLPTTPPGLYPDEAMNGNNALEAIATGNYKVFYPENNGREGFFINLQAIALNATNLNEPWVLRSVSVFFGLLTVIGVYMLTLVLLERYPYAKRVALLAMFFIATSFWHINFSRIGFRAIMAPAFMAWGLYFLIKTLGTNSQPPTTNNLRHTLYALLGGILYGLGMHSYIAYRATPLIIIAALFLFAWCYRAPLKKMLPYFILYIIAAIVVFAPLGWYFAKHPADFMGRTTQVSVFDGSSPLLNLAQNTFKTVGMFFVDGDYNWRHNLSGSAQLAWPVAICFGIGIIYALFLLFRKRDKTTHTKDERTYAGIISLVWLAVAFLPVVLSNEGIPHALRSILMIPPAMILAALGADWVIGHAQLVLSKKALALALVCIGISLVTHTYIMYHHAWRKNQNTQDAFAVRYVQLGRAVNELSPAIKKYIVVNTGGVDVRGIPMPSQTIMFITDSFTPEKQKQKNIIYVTSTDTIPSPTDGVVFFLEPENNKQ